MPLRSRIWLATLLLCLLTTLRAEEGMFPFNAIPKDDIQKKYGVEITDAWLLRAQHACVRFNIGGTGSFVSPHGLVMTNHHVAQDSIQKLSSPENDLMKTGFHARSQAEELKAPDVEVDVLQSIEDVTPRVNAAVKPEMPPEAAQTVRQAAIAAIEKEAKEKTKLRCDVVPLYGAAQYHLYTYKTYRDVRLVFAPEYGIAGFGGDPDNFNFPRYDLDVSFYRIYENDKPLESSEYLKWSKDGAKEGDPLFVAGHPGSTSRLYTVSHLEYMRDTWLPTVVAALTRQREMLIKYGKKSDEHARRAKDELLNVENSLKSLKGELDGLKAPGLLEQKAATEKAFRAKNAAEFAKARLAVKKSIKDEVDETRRKLAPKGAPDIEGGDTETQVTLKSSEYGAFGSAADEPSKKSDAPEAPAHIVAPEQLPPASIVAPESEPIVPTAPAKPAGSTRLPEPLGSPEAASQQSETARMEYTIKPAAAPKPESEEAAVVQPPILNSKGKSKFVMPSRTPSKPGSRAEVVEFSETPKTVDLPVPPEAPVAKIEHDAPITNAAIDRELAPVPAVTPEPVAAPVPAPAPVVTPAAPVREVIQVAPVYQEPKATSSRR